MPEGLNSDLNLNSDAPQRVRPMVGEWGPLAVPSTRAKRAARWLAMLALVAVVTTLVIYGQQYVKLLQ